MKYELHKTELYEKQFNEIQKRDKTAAQRIETVANRLVQHPETYDGPLHGPWAGHLKKYVGKNKHRIVYKYCEYCLKMNKKKCEDCTKPNNAVILCAVFPKKEGYD